MMRLVDPKPQLKPVLSTPYESRHQAEQSVIAAARCLMERMKPILYRYEDMSQRDALDEVVLDMLDDALHNLDREIAYFSPE